MILGSLPIPGLLITGTDTDVGKTVIAGAIAHWFKRRGRRVAVLKPVASGCVKRREGLVSEDAEYLAVCAGSPHPLDLICPVRYAEPLAPAVAARRLKEAVDWEAVRRSIQIMSADSDVMIVEGVGGVMVPMDEKHLMVDVARMLAVPAVVVARAGLGTINHTVLSVRALQQAGVVVAGVVVNCYPADAPGVVEETNLGEIEKWTKVPILAVVPEEPKVRTIPGAEVMGAIELADWDAQLGLGR